MSAGSLNPARRGDPLAARGRGDADKLPRPRGLRKRLLAPLHLQPWRGWGWFGIKWLGGQGLGAGGEVSGVWGNFWGV